MKKMTDIIYFYFILLLSNILFYDGKYYVVFNKLV